MNFAKLFTDYKIPFIYGDKRGIWINVKCPHCEDRTFNGGFNAAGDYYHCWRCGGKHQLYDTLSKILNIPKSQIDDITEDYRGKNDLLFRLNGKAEINNIKLELPTDTFTTAERKYLKSRDFSPRFLHEKYGVVGGGIAGKWKFRIIVPLIIGGKIVSWTGRSILSKEELKERNIPRYKNLSIDESVMNPKSVLFNIDHCTSKTAVLTEGAFDCFRLGDSFFCSFGTELTQAQISEIKNRFSKVFIMFDNEELAQKKARRFGLQLSAVGVDVEVVDAYGDFGKNDGGELSADEVRIIRKELGLSPYITY